MLIIEYVCVCVTYLCPGTAAPVSVHVFQAQDLEGGERRGSRLGGDHPSEPCDRPRPHVIVVSAHWQKGNDFNNTIGRDNRLKCVRVAVMTYLRSGVSLTA